MDVDKRHRYELRFCKKADLIFISHLDLMTLIRRAIRRSDLPFLLTKGFTPRVKISIPRALKLGVESDSEHMTLWLSEELSAGRVMSGLNSQLPQGVRILEVEDIEQENN